MIEDKDSQLEVICVFIDDILDDMYKLKRSTKKDDLFAYIDSWKTNLNTIKTITEL
tara:strand:- start:241 stop:408 length:168 start_codon:yes stop_codon:yes gene_type:complete